MHWLVPVAVPFDLPAEPRFLPRDLLLVDVLPAQLRRKAADHWADRRMQKRIVQRPFQVAAGLQRIDHMESEILRLEEVARTAKASAENLDETISEAMTLEAGDIIFTGTPAGVGLGHKPPLWMKDGDKVEVEIERIGLLQNTIAKETT